MPAPTITSPNPSTPQNCSPGYGPRNVVPLPKPASRFFNPVRFVVDFAARQVKLNGVEVKLTPTEYSLLRVLVQNAGKVVTHRQLLRTVWGEKAESQAQYLRVYVTHLRKKLEPDAEPPILIKTEVGIGYRLSTAGL